MDRADNYIAAVLKAMTNTRYFACSLDLKVEYTNVEQSWYLIGLIKDKDSHAAVNYALYNDLVPVSNGTYLLLARLIY